MSSSGPSSLMCSLCRALQCFPMNNICFEFKLLMARNKSSCNPWPLAFSNSSKASQKGKCWSSTIRNGRLDLANAWNKVWIWIKINVYDTVAPHLTRFSHDTVFYLTRCSIQCLDFPYKPIYDLMTWSLQCFCLYFGLK